MSTPGSQQGQRKLLITAGPTHEPIDAVRYLANRSSGRLGVALADEAARCGWRVTMLLGPSSFLPQDSSVDVHRFQTTKDLEVLLNAHFPDCDVLIMAAAVADYRPASGEIAGKIERSGGVLNLALEPTPDLVRAVAARKRPGQRIVGFALAPRDSLENSAKRKMIEKGLDAVVGNPLATMDSEDIEATVWLAGENEPVSIPCRSKQSFASEFVANCLSVLNKK